MSSRDRALTWLGDRLASGPVAASVIVAQARGVAIAKRTLDRAKVELGVASVKVGGRWFWQGCHEIDAGDRAPTPVSDPLLGDIATCAECLARSDWRALWDAVAPLTERKLDWTLPESERWHILTWRLLRAMDVQDTAKVRACLVRLADILKGGERC